MKYSIVSTCDGSLFGDAAKEKYEGIYLRIVEVTNVLAAKLEVFEGYKPEYFDLKVGLNVALILQTSTSGNVPLENGAFLGYFGEGGNWECYYDATLDHGEILVDAPPGIRPGCIKILNLEI